MAGIVIIGAGHGGAQAAASLRQGGYDGDIRLISEEAVLPYYKPPLSKSFLKNAAETQQLLFSEAFYADQKIDLLLNTRVAAIDRIASRITLSSGQQLSYAHLVLATGARGRKLAVPHADLDNIFGLRDAADAHKLRAALSSAQTIVIIGGGFIGLEAAATFAALGRNVTVLEAAPRLLGRAVSPAISAYIAAKQRARGIRVITQTSIGSFVGAGGRVRAVLTSTGETLPADLVLVGIGALANDDLAKNAGLVHENGIVVDQALRSSTPNILAIGDCAVYRHWHANRAVRLESVQNAVDHAKHAAKTILGDIGEYGQVPWFWSDQGDTRLQMAGLAFDADRYVVMGTSEDDAFSVYHFKQDRLLAVDSVNRTLDHMLARKLIAARLSPLEADIRSGPERIKQIVAASH
jgi:3-phenylpropionate/trans-cinnamate dioxygenase ferredoxin reductase subunit